MMWKGVPTDELLAEEFVLPAQFARGWHRLHTAERRLAFAVLWRAVLDLCKHRFAVRRRHQRFYCEAWEWVASTDRSWEFSFERLCEEFRIEPDGARASLLDVRRAFQPIIPVEGGSKNGKDSPPGGFDRAA